MKDIYGLLERDWAFIRQSLEKFIEIDRAILFGSRAIGNYKLGSDVDIAIVGDAITDNTLLQLNEWLNEFYPLPYIFDLHDYNSISNDNLKMHIDMFGKDIYVRQS